MTDRALADRIYNELAAVIERRLPELSEGGQDRLALEDCLAGLRLRAPSGPRSLVESR